MKKIFACALALGPVWALAVDVYSVDGTQGWWPNDVRSGGSLTLTNEQASVGNGSLRITTDSNIAGSTNAKSYVSFFSGSPFGTLGQLAAGSISLDIFKSSLSSANLSTHDLAFQIHWRNANGQTGNLTWENNYNGSATVPTDAWRTLDFSSGNYWIRSQPTSGGSSQNFDVAAHVYSLSNWTTGVQAINGGFTSQALSAGTEIMGFSIGFGSGVTGQMVSYIDNFNVQFGGPNGFGYSANFEAVPEPFTMSLGIAGIALAIRKRRKK